jgi:hypothetical protein
MALDDASAPKECSASLQMWALRLGWSDRTALGSRVDAHKRRFAALLGPNSIRGALVKGAQRAMAG